MKKIITQIAIVFIATALLNSCRKLDDIAFFENASHDHGHLKQTKNYSSEVVFKWIDMQLRLSRTNPTPIGGVPTTRYYGYSAIALYESVVPGMPAFKSLSGQLTDMPEMPQTNHGSAYYWPECGNAALAAMTRSFFPNATVANKAAVDSLENVLNLAYQMETDNQVFQRSADFGKSVAQAVFNWSTTDGAANANAPYVPPTGPGLWVPTPPAFLAPFGPFWGNNRLMVSNSLDGSAPQAPPVYSEDPSSDFYKMVKDVYDISQNLTPDQIATAVYYRDNPGFGGGHYLSIFKQILVHENPRLDFTASAFAKVTIALFDGGIGGFKTKYQYNQERPVTFIRSVLGHSTWSSAVPTPNFPDFPSAHSVASGAFAETMEGFFGSNYHFTDHSYDYLGMPSRTYTSFEAFVKDIGDARVFGGIHYRISCDRAAIMGRKIAENINKTVEFMKE
jgi:hypothetical protein